MSSDHPLYFLVQLALTKDLEDPQYEKLREYLQSKSWTPIYEEREPVSGLLHCLDSEQDLCAEAQNLVHPRDRISVECLLGDVSGDAPLLPNDQLCKWLDGYIPRNQP